MTEKDLLKNVMEAKRKLGYTYQKLSDAVDEFEDKYYEKGIKLGAIVDWKTKTDLALTFNDCLPDNLNEIVEDFQETFNLELDSIIKEDSQENSMRKGAWVHYRFVFHHKDKYSWIFKSNQRNEGLNNEG